MIEKTYKIYPSLTGKYMMWCVESNCGYIFDFFSRYEDADRYIKERQTKQYWLMEKAK